MRVEVYRNLHTGTWSVRDTSTGRVIAHPDTVWMVDAKFVVRPAGRAKVRREKRKNVHAFVRGTMIDMGGSVPRRIPTTFRKTSYNPYVNDTFVDGKGNPVESARMVWMDVNDAVYFG